MNAAEQASARSLSRSRLRSATELLASLLRQPEGLIGAVILIFFIGLAASPDVFSGPLETAATATGSFLEPPTGKHLSGTDEVGRDILNLVIHGARVSLTIALLATLVT